MSNYWYCTGCKHEVDGANVTFSEHHDLCNYPVVSVAQDHMAVPIDLVKAVAHIGVDFGYGKYELESKWIDKARELYESTLSNARKTETDKAINIGLYDTLYECECGYKYCQSIDATDKENAEEKAHDCKTQSNAQK